MKKKILLLVGVSILAMGICGCGAKKIVHCDKCGVEIKVDEDSNVDEDWILYCDDCGKDIEDAIMDIIEE